MSLSSTPAQQARHRWSAATLLGLTLIPLGIFIAIVTFFTVIGTIAGLLLSAFGIYILVRGAKTSARATNPRSEEAQRHP